MSEDKGSAADIRRVKLMQRLLRERGYIRDIRGFWSAPDTLGLKPEALRDSEDEDEE